MDASFVLYLLAFFTVSCIVLATMSSRMRITRGKTGSRRSHHGLSEPRLSHDKETNSTHLRHHVDLETGMYRGKQIFTPKVKKSKVAEAADETVEKIGEIAEDVKEVGAEIKENIEEAIEAVTSIPTEEMGTSNKGKSGGAAVQTQRKTQDK